MSDITDLRERIVARARADQLPPRARTDRSWYEVRNAAGDGDGTAVLRIYDEIHWLFGVSAEQFAEDLATVTAPELRVEINSPGGDVFDGIAIYNALRAHPARVTTRVDGIAASAASVIVQAGDHRVMLSSAQQMIHEAWGIAIGPADDHRELADLLDKENDVIAGIYASRSGREAAEFRDIMRTDTYLTDQEALDLGLADEIVEPPRQDGPDARLEQGEVVLSAAQVEAFARLADAIERTTDDQVGAAILAALTTSAPPGGGDPSAGQREDEPPAPAAAGGVDQEEADRLLAELTFDKEH